MANTINDLYLKYVNRVGASLEKDRYFQYLFEMVRAGENTLQQKKQVLHKVVDERWLTAIEESLDAINAIIEKPRRFVTTSEQVVPVALARKITADSVRHLSMNTQFIAGDEDGEIQPTRVLNVSTEESYDLYENRFIYHLIRRLVTFIDKRTDVIFWSTGDETRDVLSYTGKVDDAYEQIEYKLEMNIKGRRSFAENDSDNMQVFMRIDRVRRLVMALRNSSFCSLMSGCTAVHSPIQRTNLMMKDPNYRTCYKLWQFLERYEDVGYTVEVQDTALEFDEEYLLQLYTNFITNYTVFKSILEADERDVNAEQPKRRRVIKPKFIKKIEEQIVDDYDLPDVEVRRIFVEEVTQAQLDAEEKLANAEQTLSETQAALAELETHMDALHRQLAAAEEHSAAAEAQAAEAQRQMQLLSEQLKAEQTAREEADRRAISEMNYREETERQAAQELSEMEKHNDEVLAELRQKAKADAENALCEMQRIKQESDLALEAERQARLLAESRLEEETALREKAEQAASEAGEARKRAETAAEQHRRRADDEAQARRRAQEKADANSLSKYIVTALNNRRAKSGGDESEK
jgi:hypothetical protein